MGYNTRKIGTEYERKAGAFLEAGGYVIQEYNFRCRMGEIDIIARDGKCLVFCEVKYRSGPGSGHPAEAVDEKKQRIISKCALQGIECRFDVVSIEGDEITLYKNAFDYIG